GNNTTGNDMECLSGDLTIATFDVEELFTLSLVCKHFWNIMNSQEIVTKLTSLYIPVDSYPATFLSSLPRPFFSLCIFGKFISLYDTVIITKRVRKYFPSTTVGEALRPVLL